MYCKHFSQCLSRVKDEHSLILVNIYICFIRYYYIMQYTGTVKFIWPKETIGANALEKQTIVLEEESEREYKGGLAVDFFKDKIELLNGIKKGDLITVYLNTRVNESKTQPGRYFNSVTGRRLEQWAGSESKGSSSKKEESNDDLPF